MTEQELEEFVLNAIGDYDGEEPDVEFDVLSVTTFADAGVLTNNAGLVIRVDNAEFQLTIVRSR